MRRHTSCRAGEPSKAGARTDGMSEAEADSAPEGAPTAPGSALPDPVAETKPKKRRKKLHWTAVADEDIGDDSVWATAGAELGDDCADSQQPWLLSSVLALGSVPLHGAHGGGLHLSATGHRGLLAVGTRGKHRGFVDLAGHLLELVLGLLLILGVLIGVPLEPELTECLLDRLGVGRARDAENLRGEGGRGEMRERRQRRNE